MLGGLFAAITAIISASRMNSGQPTSGTGFEMIVISSVVLGGVSMNGGRGKVTGVILGVILLSMLSNGLVLLNVSSFYQEIVRGLVMVLAVMLDANKKRKMDKRLVK